MKKIIFSLVCSVSLLISNPINEISGKEVNKGINEALGALDIIWKKFNELDRLSKGTLSQCIPLPNKASKVNICSLIPDMGYEIEICGKGIYNNPRIPLQEYCNFGGNSGKKTEKQGGGTISTTENRGKDIGGGTYTGGGTPKTHYGNGGKGNIKKVIQDKSIANTSFLQNNQDNLKLLDDIAKDTGKGIDEITIDDIVSKTPKDQEAYFKERDTLIQSYTQDLISYSPYSLSIALEQGIRNLQGSAAKNKANQITQKAIEALDIMQNNREANELEKIRKSSDFVYPTKEMVDLLRNDKKIEAVVKIQEQIKREADAIAKIRVENEKRKNILLLTEQKALIMNEKFDRASARKEIEALIK